MQVLIFLYLFCKIRAILAISRRIFEKKIIKSDFRKIHPVGAELFHAVKQTDTTKLIVAFQSFAKGPKRNRCGRDLAFPPLLQCM